MEKSYKNKVIWITGATGGIGEALAAELVSAGARVILSARNEQRLEHSRANLASDENVFVLPIDLETGGFDRIVAKASARWGRIDYMIHNAGIVARDLAEETGMDMYRKIMQTNFFGTVELTKAVIPVMKSQGSGRFVVLSSLSGKYGIPKLSAYSASKFALHGFFESLRSEMHPHNIGVTMVVPGMINTHIVANGFDGTGVPASRDLSINQKGMSPQECARSIIRKMDSREELLVGGPEMLSVYLKRFFPSLVSLFIRNHPVRRMRMMLNVFRKPIEKLSLSKSH